MNTYKHYIHGQWVDSASGELMEVQNPANEEIFAMVQAGNAIDAQKALASSEKAQKVWGLLPAPERAKYLYAIIDKIKERKNQLAEILVSEQGKTYREALFEVDDTCAYILYAAQAATRIQGDIFPADQPNEQLWIQKVPYGVTVGLCAWNYPLALIGRKLGPALVTGNTMVIKPHELTPVSAAVFFEIIHEVGLPAGVANLVTGDGIELGNALVSSPITKLITVTGSVRAGQAIYKAAAPNITALSLELGGKSPFIVMDDADIDIAVQAAVNSRFANCGQVCICNEQMVVHKNILDELTSKMITETKKLRIGDPMTDVDMGPKVAESELDKMDRIIQKTVTEGAQIALGGGRLKDGPYEKGFWYEPTILTGVTPDMCASKEEIFGPVLGITAVDSFDEALAFANDSPYGLSAYLFSKDYSKLMRAINELDVGTIFFNKGISGAMQGYHNGHKLSGLGGEDGIYGIEGYLQKRTVYLKY
ncbi:aldehyde dehydrogenase [Vallitalea pronyensis]|uniref:3-sulfolactaldehyde dehydrogenase n=1 Tax=Vallitalea pronyensis TaxID=1348613 RepID=A0A8J8SIS7_9FIRM|nr:aldehyde dehydrogenase [Vallitalea pronyensis]QUI24823.1 aldehyde dehydrogenase [Vallitalea pronyensis]